MPTPSIMQELKAQSSKLEDLLKEAGPDAECVLVMRPRSGYLAEATFNSKITITQAKRVASAMQVSLNKGSVLTESIFLTFYY